MKFTKIKTLIALSCALTFQCSLYAQKEIIFGEEVKDHRASGLDNLASFHKPIVDYNNHFYFTKLYERKREIVQIFRFEDNSMVSEFVFDSPDEESMIPVSSVNKDYYYLIRIGANETVVTLYDQGNAEVSKNTTPKLQNGSEVTFHSISEVEDHEVVTFLKQSENDGSSVLCKKVVNNSINDELVPYMDLSLDNVNYKWLLSTETGSKVALNLSESKDFYTIKYTKVTDELSLNEPGEFTCDKDYRGYNGWYEVYDDPADDGFIFFGKKSNTDTKKVEFYVLRNNNFVEFDKKFDEKVTLNSERIYPNEDYFLMVSSYEIKKGVNRELGIFTLKVDYEGKILEEKFEPLLSKAKADESTNIVSDFELPQSRICVFETTKMNNTDRGFFTYLTCIHVVRIDKNGSTMWKQEFSNYEKRENTVLSPLARKGLYAMNNGEVFVVHQDIPMQDRFEVVKISSEGEIISKEEYVSKTKFKMLKDSKILDDGRLVIRALSGDSPRKQRNFEYTNVRLW